MKIKRVAILVFLLKIVTGCQKRDFENGTVCVCNSDYCDTVPKINVSIGTLQMYFTGKSFPGYNVNNLIFTNIRDNSAILIEVNSENYQKILGFGGAFTDATGENINKLPTAAQRKVLESYFSEDGIEYNLCRVPIGGTDFSPRAYTYDDYDNDLTLKNFKLQNEDYLYKIPLIQEAESLKKNGTLRLFGSAWTAPLWMKNNPIWAFGYTVLRDKYYQLFADYTVNFFKEYQKQNVNFWGLTTGNEPINGFRMQHVNCMGWTNIEHAQWIGENLGPTLKKSGFEDLKLMIHDDNLLSLPFVVPQLLNNENVLPFVDGVATHWYQDNLMAPEIRSLAKSDKKDIFLLSTEACHFGTFPDLGNWTRASEYIDNIITNLEFGSVGWVDWNMVLNHTGGFTYINKPADAPIIISENEQEFYKQPMFYALGHFSKFVVPGSIRLGTSNDGGDSSNIKVLAFLRPDNLKTITILNRDTQERKVQIKDGSLYSEFINLPQNSISTILYFN